MRIKPAPPDYKKGSLPRETTCSILFFRYCLNYLYLQGCFLKAKGRQYQCSMQQQTYTQSVSRILAVYKFRNNRKKINDPRQLWRVKPCRDELLCSPRRLGTSFSDVKSIQFRQGCPRCALLQDAPKSYIHTDRCGTVVKVLYYKSEGRWFDPSWCH